MFWRNLKDMDKAKICYIMLMLILVLIQNRLMVHSNHNWQKQAMRFLLSPFLSLLLLLILIHIKLVKLTVILFTMKLYQH